MAETRTAFFNQLVEPDSACMEPDTNARRVKNESGQLLRRPDKVSFGGRKPTSHSGRTCEIRTSVYWAHRYLRHNVEMNAHRFLPFEHKAPCFQLCILWGSAMLEEAVLLKQSQNLRGAF